MYLIPYLGPWATSDLNDVVEMLSHVNMVCYFTVKGGSLLKLTKERDGEDSWRSKYDVKISKSIGWGNVICANTILVRPIVLLFDSMAQNYAKKHILM